MTLTIIPILCSLLLFQNVQGFSRDDPVVVTKVGSIRGLRADNGNYTMFLGIPYAQVNLSFPFGDTLPVEPFEEVFEAYNDDIRCPQIFQGEITGTLDCLHVNIHVPDSAASDNLLPVMIYVFGGRFVIGTAGRYLSGPEYLVRHDVIFVSIGYRLGPYGFMCLDIPEVPGNNGLRDQEKAFEWIKDNIESFYGDTSRMTLFGNSAGAMSVGLQLLSSKEKVYRNAILQSGSSLFRDLIRPSDPELPMRIAARMGLNTDDIYEALSFLSTKQPYEVIEHDDSMDPAYYPCVEKSFPGVTAFLPDYPVNLRHDHIEGMSVLQGYAIKESLPTITQESYYNDIFKDELSIGFDFDGQTLAQAESLIRRFYIGDEDINENVFWELIDFNSDFYFAYSAVRMLPRYFDSGVEKVYQYVLSYDGSRNYGKISQNVTHLPGATHGDCLGYLFSLQHPGVPQEFTEEDQIILDRMTTMWTNFAKYNDPTPETSELIPVKWEPVTKDSPEYYMEIDNTLKLGKAHEHRRMNFWNLFFKHYQEYEMGYRSGNEAEEDSLDDSASIASVSPILMLGIILNLFFRT